MKIGQTLIHQHILVRANGSEVTHFPPDPDGIVRVFACGICRELYTTEAEAAECYAEGKEPAVFRPGDIVVTDRDGYGPFGWFDGDADWVIDNGPSVDANGIVHTPSGRFYSLVYVVTAVDWKGHEIRYHIETKGMTGKHGHRSGWYGTKLRAAPPDVQARDLDGSDLIGHTFNYYIG